jgi:hypothetical protein
VTGLGFISWGVGGSRNLSLRAAAPIILTWKQESPASKMKFGRCVPT